MRVMVGVQITLYHLFRVHNLLFTSVFNGNYGENH